MEEDRDEYSVCVFFPDGRYSYVHRYISAKRAVETVVNLTKSSYAKRGLYRKITITDGGDDTNYVWEFGKGITYPTAAQLRESSDDT